MNELNVEMLKGDGGFFVMLLLLIIACGMGIWREVRWARVCNDEYDKGYEDGVVDITVKYSADTRKLEELGERIKEKGESVPDSAGVVGSADVPDSVINEINAGYEGYVLGRSTEAEGFEAAHRGEIY